MKKEEYLGVFVPAVQEMLRPLVSTPDHIMLWGSGLSMEINTTQGIRIEIRALGNPRGVQFIVTVNFPWKSAEGQNNFPAWYKVMQLIPLRKQLMTTYNSQSLFPDRPKEPKDLQYVYRGTSREHLDRFLREKVLPEVLEVYHGCVQAYHERQKGTHEACKSCKRELLCMMRP